MTLIALAILWPFVAIIALLIKLDSPGPVIFTQTRIGKGGRPFRIFKFRSLKHNVDRKKHDAFMRAFVQGEIKEYIPGKKVYKPFDKSQITRVGRVLRETSLDELPQLVNVLIGDMSLVGPRPNVICEVEAYQDWHRERLTVLPGITGLAQINGRSGINFDTIVKYDIEYVRNQSLWLDLRILWKTALSVVSGQGAH
jgi:lipopolysaccharide/colanic/teichoic acid biosynthesis glycosyltransferase